MKIQMMHPMISLLRLSCFIHQKSLTTVPKLLLKLIILFRTKLIITTRSSLILYEVLGTAETELTINNAEGVGASAVAKPILATLLQMLTAPSVRPILHLSTAAASVPLSVRAMSHENH